MAFIGRAFPGVGGGIGAYWATLQGGGNCYRYCCTVDLYI